MIDKKKLIITKSNDLVEAKFKLTALEQKFILLMSSMIHPKDKEFIFYRIAIKDILGKMGLEKCNDSYKLLKNLIIGLNRKSLVIPQNNGDALITTWVASAQYFNKKGFIEFEVPEKLKPYLLELNKKFTKLHFEDVIQLKSSYSIRIYELISQFKNIGFRCIKLDDLREMLGLNENIELGVKKSKYKLYGHLKVRVLEIARRELEQKCNIFFEYKEIYVPHSRKVETIKFFIIQKKFSETNKEKISEIKKDISLLEQIKNFGIAEKFAKNILKNKSIEEVISDIEYINLDKSSKRNLAGYALTIFNNRKMPEEEIKQKELKIIKLQKKDTDRLNDDYEIYVENEIKFHIASLKKSEIMKIKELSTNELIARQNSGEIKKSKFDSLIQTGIENRIYDERTKRLSKLEFYNEHKNEYPNINFLLFLKS